MRKIHKKVFDYIEFELRNYDNLKRQLKQEEADHIYHGGTADLNSGIKAKYKKNNSVENAAIGIISSAAIKRIDELVTAIDDSLGELDKKYKDFFKKYYLSKSNVNLYISERSIYNYREKIVTHVAQKLGFL